MITKGIIEETRVSDSGSTVANKYKLRLPLFETQNNEPFYMNAIATVAPGMLDVYKKGDVVIVAFELNLINHPVILGKLYTGATAEDDRAAQGKLKCNALEAEVASIPAATKLTNWENNQTYTSIEALAGAVSELNQKIQRLDGILQSLYPGSSWSN